MSDLNTRYDMPDFDEASSSQIPAILQLINLDYTYIPRGKVETLREGRNQYILRGIAKLALRAINPDWVSEKSIEEAVLSLEKVKLDDGVAKASELIYSDLICGRLSHVQQRHLRPFPLAC